jgi:hypothetical protein
MITNTYLQFLIIKSDIFEWAKKFITIFQKYSRSGLQLPKLHSWCYHSVAAIREYGSINSMTTETYETLHKYFVKMPYKLSNKKDFMPQIVDQVSLE